MVTHVGNTKEWLAFCQRTHARGRHGSVAEVGECDCCREVFLRQRFAIPPTGIRWGAEGFVLSTTAALMGAG